ncbi:hypothetical protein BH23CHL7_BH23CHL7_05500 [soil metagenome]
MTPADGLQRHRPGAAALPDEPPFWRDPPRLALLSAGALLGVGSLIPWAVGHDGVGLPMDYRATQATGEGVVMLAGAVLLVFLARDRLMWETSSRLVQLLPVLVALFVGALSLSVENYAAQRIEEWQLRGGAGELTVARYLVLGGMALAVSAVLWLERRRSADVRQHTRSLIGELGITRWSALTVLITLLFGVAGASLSAIAIMISTGIEGLLPAVFLGIFGLFGGIAVGVRFARWLERVSGR